MELKPKEEAEISCQEKKGGTEKKVECLNGPYTYCTRSEYKWFC